MPTEASPLLRIEKLVYGGDGLARSDGIVVLLPFVLPGELVRAGLQRAKNDLRRGTLRSVVEPAPQRIQPACPYFLRCGGCHYQHASYEFQLDQKRAILREVLRRVGRIELDCEIASVAAEPWNYRNRTQLHIHDGSIGYFAPGSHQLVAIDQCPIASPRLNQAIASLAHDLPSHRRFDATVELFTNEIEIQVNLLDRIPFSVRPVFDSIGTRDAIEYAGFRVSRTSFFQVNRFLLDRLVDLAVGDAHGSHALDLYAGVGLFANRLARQCSQVTAVESGGSAFRDLEFNLQRSQLPVTALQQNVEDFLASLQHTPDFVLADPPRAGLGKAALAQLIRLHPPRLSIVSCDPATLARDLRPLLEAGYHIDAITLVDLFPQTFHLETVVTLAG